jgi:hypothetical protein
MRVLVQLGGRRTWQRPETISQAHALPIGMSGGDQGDILIRSWAAHARTEIINPTDQQPFFAFQYDATK